MLFTTESHKAGRSAARVASGRISSQGKLVSVPGKGYSSFRFRDRVLHDCLHQSKAESLLRADLFSGYEHFESAGLANQPGQPLRSSPSGDESERGATVAEHRAGCGNTAMTGERQIEASTHAVAGNGGVDGGRKLLDRAHEFLPQPRKLVAGGTGEGGNFRELCARGEKLLVAGNNQRPGAGRKLGQHISQPLHTFATQTIRSVCRVETQQVEAASFLQKKATAGNVFDGGVQVGGQVTRTGKLRIPGNVMLSAGVAEVNRRRFAVIFTGGDCFTLVT